MNPKENLPQQICDLCIVQLNVSYNFKRLALKNDFQIRQYMIENGISLMKDDDDGIETTTALEIHQIQHNVIRTNRYRTIAGPEIRRNSTTSSLSGASTTIINGRENDATPNNTAASNFVTPKPAMVRPIQIKVEPVDPDEAQEKGGSHVTSSPSNVSEPASIVTISSSTQSEKRSPPMVVINGVINNESFKDKRPAQKSSSAAPLSVKLTRQKQEDEEKSETARDRSQLDRPLRSIRKEPSDLRKSKRKIVAAVKAKNQPADAKKNVKNLKKSTSVRVVSKKDMKTGSKPRGRPPKAPGAPKLIYKKRAQVTNKKRS